VIEVQVGERETAASARLQRSFHAVKGRRVEPVICSSAKEPRHCLTPPDAVDAIVVRPVPELAQADGERRAAEGPSTPDHPLGSRAEVPLEALVGVDAEDPLGVESKRGGHQRAVVPHLVPLGPAGRHAKQLEDGFGFGEQLGRAVTRPVVQRDDAVDCGATFRRKPGR
jgi:hypothetical protein